MHHAQPGRFHGFTHLLFRWTRAAHRSNGEDKHRERARREGFSYLHQYGEIDVSLKEWEPMVPLADSFSSVESTMKTLRHLTS